MHDLIIVEDCESDAELLTRALWQLGVCNPIRVYGTGREALGCLEEMEQQAGRLGKPIASILMIDLKLPDLTGFEILEWIRKRPMFSESLRIVLSQSEEIRGIMQAYELGAHSFLLKPARSHELEELIQLYPEPWILATNTPAESSLFRDPGAIFRENQKAFENVRANLKRLREQMCVSEEMMAAIENIIGDIRERREKGR